MLYKILVPIWAHGYRADVIWNVYPPEWGWVWAPFTVVFLFSVSVSHLNVEEGTRPHEMRHHSGSSSDIDETIDQIFARDEELAGLKIFQAVGLSKLKS